MPLAVGGAAPGGVGRGHGGDGGWETARQAVAGHHQAAQAAQQQPAGGNEAARVRPQRRGRTAERLLHQAPRQDREREEDRGAARQPGRRHRQLGHAREDDHRPVPQVERVGDGAEEGDRAHAERRADQRSARSAIRMRCRAGVDDRRRGEARDQARQPRHRRRVRDGGHAQGERDGRRDRRRLRDPPSGERRDQPVREQAADQELEHARRHQEEGRFGPPRAREDASAERHAGDREEARATAPARAGQRPDQQRRGEVELRLHPEAPAVQERLGGGGLVEVAELGGEQDVGHEQHRADQAARHVVEVARHQREHRDAQRHRRHEEQGRQRAARASAVEAEHGYRDARRPGEKLPADQEPGDDEEHVDPDEPAAEARQVQVGQDDDGDRHGAQAVDVGAVAARLGRASLGRASLGRDVASVAGRRGGEVRTDHR